MSCPDFETLSAFADGESPAAERASLGTHLSCCAACCVTVESIAAERRALSGMAVPPMPADLKAALEAMVPRPAPRIDAVPEDARHRSPAGVDAAPRIDAVPEDARHRSPAGVEAKSVWLAQLRMFFSPRVLAAAAAACLALFMWARHAEVFSPRLEVPAEFLAAAHNQYALSLRLAPSEKIMTEMPAQLSAGIPEGRDVY